METKKVKIIRNFIRENGLSLNSLEKIFPELDIIPKNLARWMQAHSYYRDNLYDDLIYKIEHKEYNLKEIEMFSTKSKHEEVKKEQEEIVPKYIIENLKRHGNTIITVEKLKEVGEDKLISTLSSKGFKVDLHPPLLTTNGVRDESTLQEHHHYIISLK